MSVRQDSVRIGQRKFKYTYLEHPGAVFSVGLTGQNEVILIRIFRYPIDEWCWEIPSGGMGDKSGKSPLRVAKDELREEAGGVAKKWISLGWRWSANGVARLKLHFFLALDVDIREQELEESEQISHVVRVPLNKINSWLKKHRIRDGDSELALLLALRHLESKESSR